VSTRAAGFTLLPVIVAMMVIAAVAFALNRANAFNANMTASRGDLERARYAAEAGLHAANAIVQQKSCVGGFPVAATPLADTNFGGAAYSAYASAASGSPLTVTSTGTYNGASVTLNRNSVYVYNTTVRTYVHRPRTSVGKDVYVDPASPNTNFAGRERVEVGGGQESLIKFDLSFFPVGTRIVSTYDAATGTVTPGARLELWRNSPDTTIAAGSFIDVHAISRVPWVETAATWNTYDGVNAWPAQRYDPRPIVTVATARDPGWQFIDVTDAAISWMGSAYVNSGLWLRSSPSGTPNPVLKFASSDEDDSSSHRPRLVLNYLLPCGAVAPVAPEGVTLAFLPVADSYVSSAAPLSGFGASTTLSANTGISDTRRTLLRFNLSIIPSGQRIQTAQLRIASTAMANPTAAAKTIWAHALVEPWTEGVTVTPGSGVTWLTRDGLLPWTLMMRPTAAALAAEELTGISPPPWTFTTGWLSWNVKGLVQEWVDGLTPNNGLVLVSTVRDDPTLVSREGTSGQRPQLVITY
jgi:Tfp pilus assembly protein PilX